MSRGLKWIICSLLLLGCTKQPIDKYCGGVVYSKNPLWMRDTIRKNDKFHKVVLYRLDYDKYNVGDTIQCSH